MSDQLNPHKVAAQHRKAFRLFETVRLDMVEVYGEDVADAHAIEAAVRDLDAEQWVVIAVRAGLTAEQGPSPETIVDIHALAMIAVEVAETRVLVPLPDKVIP